MPAHARESEIERLTTRPVRMYHRRDFFASRNVVPTPPPVMQLDCYVSVAGERPRKYASEAEAAKAVEKMKKEMR